jgi:hypothetical protein
MNHIIRASSWFVKRYLKVTPTYVEYMETAAMGGKRTFAYGQIDFVLVSPDYTLALQVGHEVFSLPYKPSKPKHRAAVDALVQNLQAGGAAAYSPTGGFPVQPPPASRNYPR